MGDIPEKLFSYEKVLFCWGEGIGGKRIVYKMNLSLFVLSHLKRKIVGTKEELKGQVLCTLCWTGLFPGIFCFVLFCSRIVQEFFDTKSSLYKNVSGISHCNTMFSMILLYKNGRIS